MGTGWWQRMRAPELQQSAAVRGVPACCRSCAPGHSLWLAPLLSILQGRMWGGGDGEKKKRRLHLGPTALGLAYGRPVRGRFIRCTPSSPMLQFRLNPFVAVILGSFVFLLINHGGPGTGVTQTAWGPC